MANKIYRGRRFDDGCVVLVTDQDEKRLYRLPLRTDVWNRSPTGFEWGYGGSGPAQLALALLLDHLGDEEQDRAIRLHQPFKRLVVAGLDRASWTLSTDQVENVIQYIETNPKTARMKGGAP